MDYRREPIRFVVARLWLRLQYRRSVFSASAQALWMGTRPTRNIARRCATAVGGAQRTADWMVARSSGGANRDGRGRCDDGHGVPDREPCTFVRTAVCGLRNARNRDRRLDTAAMLPRDRKLVRRA